MNLISRTALLGAVVFSWDTARPTEAAELRLSRYSQRDARWRQDRMEPSTLTLGGYGCMVTSLASVSGLTPRQLNSYLARNGGYTRDGLLNHGVAARAAGLSYRGRGRLPRSARSIERGISRGAVYVTRSRRFREHWVVVFRATSGRAYYLDPWDGRVYRVGDRYVSFGAEARIYRAR